MGKICTPVTWYAACLTYSSCLQQRHSMIKGKCFPYSLPSVWPRADPGVQAVSLQVTISHSPGGRLPLPSARPAVTFPVLEHHRPYTGTKLYCLVTQAHRCEQLAQGCYEASRTHDLLIDLLIASPTLYPLRHSMVQPTKHQWPQVNIPQTRADIFARIPSSEPGRLRAQQMTWCTTTPTPAPLAATITQLQHSPSLYISLLTVLLSRFTGHGKGHTLPLHISLLGFKAHDESRDSLQLANVGSRCKFQKHEQLK